MKPKRTFLLYLFVTLMVVVLAACQSATPAPETREVQNVEVSPTEQPSLGSVVAIGNDADLGSFLVDESGMTLYMFLNDAPGTSNCYDQCADNWPPLLTEGEPVAADGVDATLLGTTEREDGSMQVTYNGWPLYYWVKDNSEGDITGQGVGDVWFVVDKGGEIVMPAAVTPSVTVEDQEIGEGSVTIAEIISNGAGWLVVHAQSDGKPGSILGYAPVVDGINNDVVVDIDTEKAYTRMLAKLAPSNFQMVLMVQ